MTAQDWDKRYYHGRYNRYPFTEVVSFMMGGYAKVPDRNKVKVLDLGCGGAHHLMFLAQEGFDYHGVDGAQESVDIASQRLSDAGFPTDTIVKATFDALPYEADTMDAVIDRGAITCNNKADIPALLTEVRRVLKPGGRFFSTILNIESSAKNGAKDLGDGDFTGCDNRLEDAGVLHFTTSDEARELFSGAGFTVEKIERSVTTTDYAEDGNTPVVAWNFITCRK